MEPAIIHQLEAYIALFHSSLRKRFVINLISAALRVGWMARHADKNLIAALSSSLPSLANHKLHRTA